MADTSKGKTNTTSTRTPDETNTVLVPPDGVHTPGDTAANAAEGQPLVRAPGDAFADPEAATAAYKAAQAGEVHEVGSTNIAHQHASGQALTPQEKAQAEERDKEQEATYGDPTAKPDGITK